VLEALDRLRDAVFEDFEFRLLQIEDWTAALCGVRVNADEVHLAPEARLLILRIGGRVLCLCSDQARGRAKEAEDGDKASGSRRHVEQSSLAGENVLADRV
jgi:hypothetical protein